LPPAKGDYHYTLSDSEIKIIAFSIFRLRAWLIISTIEIVKNVESNLTDKNKSIAGAGLSVRTAKRSVCLHNPGGFFESKYHA
jgi:hypothetical protein